MTKKISVEQYGEELAKLFSEQKMVVFLCEPSLTDLTKAGAKLRKELLGALESENFEVVLRGDDGLEKLRSMYGHYAHENELQFIQGQCMAEWRGQVVRNHSRAARACVPDTIQGYANRNEPAEHHGASLADKDLEFPAAMFVTERGG